MVGQKSATNNTTQHSELNQTSPSILFDPILIKSALLGFISTRNLIWPRPSFTTTISVKMEEFLVQNAKRYQSLVKAFRPGASTQTSIESKSSTSPDIVVSTRIRPLLDEEDAAGFSESVFPRDAQPGVVDVHELRRTVRGLPTLTVSLQKRTKKRGRSNSN